MIRLAFAILLLGLLAGCDSGQPVADSIYSNGTVITMVDAQPLAEAVAVRDGKIMAVGSAAELAALAGPDTRNVDLGGKTLLPGFVDSHGHAYVMGLQATTANLLPPPDGTGADIPALQQLLRDWAATNQAAIERVGWIAGFGYDDSQLAEQRHPTREDLDAVARDIPVLIIHQSGHLGVGNSKALELAGITAETADPAGGTFRRQPGTTEPNGVAEEYAFFQLLGALAANFDDAVNDEFIKRGTALAASFGYTTVQEGRAVGPALAAMQRAADNQQLQVDLVSYADILEVDDIQPAADYHNHYRVGGAKLTIDGSPQGKTAWLTEPYYVVPEGEPDDYAGYPAVDEATVFSAVQKAYANGWQLLCHANGDRAIDLFIAAVRAAQDKYPDARLRPVLIHGQTLREDQVDELKELAIFPSLFPMHTFYWGDWHRDSVLGPARAENISPTGWVRERDMMFGTHHDAPVALPDSMRVLSATVTRRTRSGDILGPNQRVDVMTALKAMTLWPAWQHFEETAKGSLEVGKLADFVVLSDNPLEVDPNTLAELTVMETIKEDVSIYRYAGGSTGALK
ncbi:MAG: amidohydrolase [Gammaproteobacteria bacterium]|jgi:predicted amidohydrolase YtcJ|nr:amidohydrolase [Gammaproteobacteria bacterium]